MAEGGFEAEDLNEFGDIQTMSESQLDGILNGIGPELAELNDLIESGEATDDNTARRAQLVRVSTKVFKRKSDINMAKDTSPPDYSGVTIRGPESGQDGPPEDTSWIDEDISYGNTDLGIVRTLSIRPELPKYARSDIVRHGRFTNNHINRNLVKLTRSYLAISDGGGRRPMLNTPAGREVLRNIRYLKGGSIRQGNQGTFLEYKGDTVRFIFTQKGRSQVLEKDHTPEFNELVKSIFEGRTPTEQEQISPTEPNQPTSMYPTMTDSVIKDMVIEKTKAMNRGRKPKKGRSSEEIRKELDDPDLFKGSGGKNLDLTPLDDIKIPEDVIVGISNSVLEKLRSAVEAGTKAAERSKVIVNDKAEYDRVI